MTSNNSEHHLAINDEIMKRLKPTSKSYSGKRAVIVFFESIEELEVACHPLPPPILYLSSAPYLRSFHLCTGLLLVARFQGFKGQRTPTDRDLGPGA